MPQAIPTAINHDSGHPIGDSPTVLLTSTPLHNVRNYKLLTYLAIGISDAFVELLAVQDQEVFVGGQDAALGGDGPGRVHVVSRYHTDRDSCTLTLLNASGYLFTK